MATFTPTLAEFMATHQALLDARAELSRCRPVADAAHAFAASWPAGAVYETEGPLRALLEAHAATTPAETPSTHVIVERAELERLRTIADLGRQATTDHDLDNGLAAWIALRELVTGVQVGPALAVVEAAHLEWLRKVADATGELAATETLSDSPTARNLLAVLDEVA